MSDVLDPIEQLRASFIQKRKRKKSMNDKSMSEMPDFDNSLPAKQPTKKPRKPMKRRQLHKSAYAIAAESKPRRGRPPALTNKMHKSQTAIFTKDQYRVIGALMGMSVKERDAIFEIVKGLSR
jgi:hypothetical protein